jgi:hypothetical protein
VHAPTEDKSDDTKESLYEEIEGALDRFRKYHIKRLSRDFNAKVEVEVIFKP